MNCPICGKELTPAKESASRLPVLTCNRDTRDHLFIKQEDPDFEYEEYHYSGYLMLTAHDHPSSRQGPLTSIYLKPPEGASFNPNNPPPLFEKEVYMTFPELQEELKKLQAKAN